VMPFECLAQKMKSLYAQKVKVAIGINQTITQLEYVKDI
jgi:hypothetical protein